MPKERVLKVKSEIDRIFETLKGEERLKDLKESDEFEEFKKDLISKFDRILGSRELREILGKLEGWSDLIQKIQKYPQTKKVAGKFATVVPWNKVEELLRIIEKRIAEETGTKLNSLYYWTFITFFFDHSQQLFNRVRTNFKQSY